MITIYVSIGNSDDRLNQLEWSGFITAIRDEVASQATGIQGTWFSAPDSQWQNACWCLQFTDEKSLAAAMENARRIGHDYLQDSVAWATAETVFLR